MPLLDDDKIIICGFASLEKCEISKGSLEQSDVIIKAILLRTHLIDPLTDMNSSVLYKVVFTKANETIHARGDDAKFWGGRSSGEGAIGAAYGRPFVSCKNLLTMGLVIGIEWWAGKKSGLCLSVLPMKRHTRDTDKWWCLCSLFVSALITYFIYSLVITINYIRYMCWSHISTGNTILPVVN